MFVVGAKEYSKDAARKVKLAENHVAFLKQDENASQDLRDSAKASGVDQGAEGMHLIRRHRHSYENIDDDIQDQVPARPATEEHDDDEDEYEEIGDGLKDQQGARERNSSMQNAGHSEPNHVQSGIYDQQIDVTPIMCAYLQTREDIVKPVETKYDVKVTISDNILRISGDERRKLVRAALRLEEALDEVCKEYKVQKSNPVPREKIQDIRKLIDSHSMDAACVFDQETQRVICMGLEADKAIAKVNLVMHGVLHEEVVELAMDVMKYIGHFNLLPIESGIIMNMQMDEGMEVAKLTFKSKNKACVQTLKEQFIQTIVNIESNMLKEVVLAHNPSGKFRSKLENQFPDVFIDCHEEYIELTGPKASVYRAKKEIEASFKEEAMGAPSYPLPEAIKRRSQSVGASVTSITPMSFRSSNGKLHVHALVHDITRMQVDIIVNDANEKLDHGGGVALAIATAAGKELQDDCKKFIKGSKKIKVTNHWLSKPGHLRCKQVMHAVGPKWDRSGDKKSEKVCDQLRETFNKCLGTADSMNCRSIAIPPVSAGRWRTLFMLKKI